MQAAQGAFFKPRNSPLQAGLKASPARPASNGTWSPFSKSPDGMARAAMVSKAATTSGRAAALGAAVRPTAAGGVSLPPKPQPRYCCEEGGG